MDIKEILCLIFLNQRHNLDLTFKLRLICKFFKKYTEEWLIDFTDFEYRERFCKKIDVSQFRNLHKLQCGNWITNKHLKQLPHLVLKGNKHITDEGLLHLNLLVLETSYISNIGIAHMKLQELFMGGNMYIINETIQDMPLRILDISGSRSSITGTVLKNFQLTELCTDRNPNITDDDIEHLKLRVLAASGVKNKISDKGIRRYTASQFECMPLEALYANNNENITDESVQYLNLLVLFASDNEKITDKSVSKMQLIELGMDNNNMITDDGLKNSYKSLRILMASKALGLTNKSIKQMTLLTYLDISNTNITDEALQSLHHLKELHIYGTSITDAGIVHMTCLQVLDISNLDVTDQGIQGSAKTLRKLFAEKSKITNAGLKNMNLRYLNARFTPNITIEGIAHMKDCVFSLYNY